MTDPSIERHLSTASFAEYLAAGVPIAHPVAGTPRLTIFIDPDSRRIGLRGPRWDGAAPDPTMKNVETRTVRVSGENWGEIGIIEPALFTAAYPFLCAVADRVQESGQTMARALKDSLKQFARLLEGPDGLTADDEIGLIGELLLLRGLASQGDPISMIEAWQGGASEEHDFSLGRWDVEVKTTRSERRTHWISSATQLVANPGRPLWLVSFQITGGGGTGFTLPGLIEEVRILFGTDGARSRLEQKLVQYEWDDRYTEFTRATWRLRSVPASFLVAGSFPRITPTALAAGGVSHSRIDKISYQVDLTGLDEATDLPGEVADALVVAGRRFHE